MNTKSNIDTSATGGYLLPAPSHILPDHLSFEEFLQTVFVGVSGLPGELVRPKWQVNPPKQPDVYINWLAIGLSEEEPDTFSYNSIDTNGNNVFQRMEGFSVQCSFFGPRALDYAALVRDGLQIGQNREALQSVKMDFVSTSKLTRAPDLVNERWINRWEMTAYFRREVLRAYPILYVLSASGILYALGSGGVRSLPISVKEA
jgi:hypothetical protein